MGSVAQGQAEGGGGSVRGRPSCVTKPAAKLPPIKKGNTHTRLNKNCINYLALKCFTVTFGLPWLGLAFFPLKTFL